MRKAAIVFIAISVMASAACDRPAQARATRADTTKLQPSGKIDSILPSGEALRRFQAELPRTTELGGGVRSRDELVARFVSAVQARNVAALDSLVVSKAEYAFLYFPSSVYSHKPYELPPDIAWLLSDQNSRKGLVRVTRRLGGSKLGFQGYQCSDAITEGENRFWRSCQLTYIDPTTRRPIERKLFGAIIERDKRYKFLSYANDF